MTAERPLRVGVLTEGLLAWAGGFDFLVAVVQSLQAHATAARIPVELVILATQTRRREQLRSCAAPLYGWARGRFGPRQISTLKRAYRDRFTLQSFEWQVERFREAIGPATPIVRYTSLDDVERAASSAGVDCIFPVSGPLPASTRVPWVGYIFDFQHRHLPDLFSESDRAGRDEAFRVLGEQAPALVLNSSAARIDCLEFLALPERKVFALPFSAAAPAQWYQDRPALIAHHSLPRRYFLISNQFWKHKNHATAFEALKILRSEHGQTDVAMVCTGATSDNRDAAYFPALMRWVEQNDLGGSVRVLGYVPKREQVEMLKSAVCVVQPTLFEGGPGGGAVYDAVSLGVPCLVSDIPVNRELQALGVGIEFFSPHDARALAGMMRSHLESPRPRELSADALQQAGRRRRERAGEVILSAIRHATGDASRSD